ncbi:transposase is4 family protein [Leptolyngbya sp. Heron Island J]|uniref:IS5 family transposase n=1 Tax=Leptolyngbya sp. Heron Island J TaxID=1385935 RepID=UPI0003B93C1E|nr:IS5 family transposase [Leptolyngbya sp. Heron Island J]ESA38723.1 transposase is4 family protein [Leptolyngbya sp. Heron Island J]
MGQQGFWDFETCHQKLESQKDLLTCLDEMIPWDEFRPMLGSVYAKPRNRKAGRPPIDVIVMFKLLIRQQLYNISDDELEYQVNDRLSFMRFLHLGLEDSVPDAKTMWSFRERLRKAELVEPLFEQFGAYLNATGYQAQCGQIVDATLVPVPKQRNTREDTATIKAGQVPDAWHDKPHKLSQKDVDARWTQKNGTSHYGYKNHINRDAGHGFIRRYTVTEASVHDSQVLGQLLDADNADDELWADSAYLSIAIVTVLEMMGFESHINERAYRNRPLSEMQIADNRERSKTRAKVEHVFGATVNEMGGKVIRTIGVVRAETMLGLRNLAYNFKRYVFWQKQDMAEVTA